VDDNDVETAFKLDLALLMSEETKFEGCSAFYEII
jgi:hypothetical protein